MTREVWLKREPGRAEALNDQTIVLDLGAYFGWALPSPRPASFADLFRQHYSALQALLNDHPAPGLGVIAVGREGLEAAAWFEAKENEANPLILGRHTSAEIFLPSDPRLSLRHLAVILRRRRVATPVRFRVLDLRTPTAFTDEEGRRLEAIESEGPLMVQCASFAMLMFPTDGSSPPWPDDPEVAWKRVPKRVYVDSRSADPERWRASFDRAPRAHLERVEADPPGAITLVPSFPGPVLVSRALGPTDVPRGELLVSSASGRVSLRVGALAVRQGVLLGRYDRCDTAGLPVLSSPSLSRVHLLLIELDGALYAVDTASKNGSWLGSRPIRSVRIEPGLRLRLAEDATVEWWPFH